MIFWLIILPVGIIYLIVSGLNKRAMENIRDKKRGY